MNYALPFLDLSPQTHRVSVRFADQVLDLPEGANLAAALLAAGVGTLRNSVVSGQPRGPFCMMGACYDCVVRINGETVQACMTLVSDGMVIHPAYGRPEADDDAV